MGISACVLSFFSIILYIYIFPDVLRTFLQLVHKVHADAQIKRQVGILVRRVDRFPDKYVQFRTLFYDQLRQLCRAIFRVQLIKERLVKFVLLVTPQKIERLPECQDSFRHKV